MEPVADPGNPAAPRRRYDVVLMAASAGGVTALKRVISSLPPDFPIPVAIVLHRSGANPGVLAHVLGRRSTLEVKDARNGEIMRAGTVYLAPANLHMTIRAGRSIAFMNGHRIRHQRSSANPLFESAAEALGGRVIAVVLTGYDSDGTDGVQAVKLHGGIVIAQDQVTSDVFDMPKSAIQAGAVDSILPLDRIGGELVRLSRLRA